MDLSLVSENNHDATKTAEKRAGEQELNARNGWGEPRMGDENVKLVKDSKKGVEILTFDW